MIDLFIVDLKMLEMGGLEFVKKLRWECEDFVCCVFILVFIVEFIKENIFMVCDNGVNVIVSKLIYVRMLCEWINMVINDEWEFVINEVYVGLCCCSGGEGMYDGEERCISIELRVDKKFEGENEN